MTLKESTAEKIIYALLLFQRKWIADSSPVKIYEKSRQIGITWATAGDYALTAAAKKGLNCYYIGYNRDMAQGFISDCAFWAKFYNLAAGDIKESVFYDEKLDKYITQFKIRFASGFSVSALSSRPANLRGKRGKILIDEAAFHEHLKEVIDAALALLIWGGQVSIVSTHFGEDNYFNELINDCRAGKKKFSIHRTTFDDAITDGLYERICLKTGKPYSKEAEKQWMEDTIALYGDAAEEELFCIPSKGSGIFMPSALIKACMSPDIPVVRKKFKPEFVHKPEAERIAEVDAFLADHIDPLLHKIPKHSRTCFGEDFGRTGDLTVIWPLIETQLLKLETPFIVELRNCPFEQQRQILFHIVDYLRENTNFSGGAMDSRGNGQYLAEVAMQRYGENAIQQIMISESWYREITPLFKSKFEERGILIPADGDVLDDHRALIMVRGVARIPDAHGKGRDGQQRHGDAAIANMMAIYAAENIHAGSIEFESTGVVRESISAMENYLSA